MNDDPREILALLNSLGFIGITAPQLKAFIKDLKLYRKVKEREKQRRKEEIKNKIINKQKSMIKEIVNECCKEQYLTDDALRSNSSSLNDSLMKAEKTGHTRISKLEENSHSRDKAEYSSSAKASMSKENRSMSASLDGNVDLHRPNSKVLMETRLNNKSAQPIAPQERRPMSAPNLSRHVTQKPKSAVSEPVGGARMNVSTSRISARSDHKSFIRPWRLQPEHRRTKKNDPVLLYQKYQEEWKQISFPGEAKHNGVRWAVREKMLGMDPHPLPLPKKSISMPALRKK
ncbi:hypothetical protein KM043_003087 [Ampulex compressa]|nr:hypothetical protein KM043_003087 [Ampulex compressa]